MDTVHYILDNWDYLLTLTPQHLWLVALAVGLASSSASRWAF